MKRAFLKAAETKGAPSLAAFIHPVRHPSSHLSVAIVMLCTRPSFLTCSHPFTPVHTCRAELLHPDDLPASHPFTSVHTCRAELLHPDDLPAYTKMYKGHVTQRQVGGTQGT